MADEHPAPDAELIADCVARFRKAGPHVHCITNSVAQNFTANVLLAAGATPSMTIAPSEIEDFVTMADALLVNLGTMDKERKSSAELAIAAANDQHKPWALDPVFVQGSPERLMLAKSMLSHHPTLVRCNGPEGHALFGDGFELMMNGEHSVPQDMCIAKTGKVDHVTYQLQRIKLSNGHHLMDKVTTMGCALNALMIGFCAVEPNRLIASVSALALYGVAGEIAGEAANGPGTFVPLFLDALANVSETEIVTKLKLA